MTELREYADDERPDDVDQSMFALLRDEVNAHFPGRNKANPNQPSTYGSGSMRDSTARATRRSARLGGGARRS